MKRKSVWLGLAIVLIVFGAWFSTTSIYRFAKGYMAFKIEEQAAAEPAVTTKVKKETTNTDAEKAKVLYEVRPQVGEHMGELLIPKLSASVPIYHGTNEDELEKGVGHFADSVLPGEKDNSVLSGHRDTVFRRLGEVGKGDILTVKTSAGTFTYKVKKVKIVDKNDRTIIVPSSRALLTVSTCYPFKYVGAAPERYVLIASLIRSETK